MLLKKYYDWQVIKELDFNYFDSLFFYAQKKEIEEKAFPFWQFAMFTNAVTHNTEQIVTFETFLDNIEKQMQGEDRKQVKNPQDIKEKYTNIAEIYRRQKGGRDNG